MKMKISTLYKEFLCSTFLLGGLILIHYNYSCLRCNHPRKYVSRRNSVSFYNTKSQFRKEMGGPLYNKPETVRNLDGKDRHVPNTYYDQSLHEQQLETPRVETKGLEVFSAFGVREVINDCSCPDVFNGNVGEIERGKAKRKPELRSPNDYIRETKNCSKFIQDRGYIMNTLSENEKDFPIAFSILMFKAVEQSERLLRAIYRPQNIYCIHVDKKTNSDVFEAMESIANCFDNVFMSSRRFNVQWGTMTVLEPDLNCMEDLLNLSKSWKYFINLTGQEFPLKTNYELVEILKAYNGANDLEGTRKRANKDRWEKAGTPPHGIVPTKGSVHIVVNRAYVEFVMHDQRAKDFLDWCRNVNVPDEVYFSSLQHNPQLDIPGAYKGIPESHKVEVGTEKPFLARFKNWMGKTFHWECMGKRVRSVCIIGVGDLPLLADRKELFVNKLHHDYQPIAYDCLEELHFNRTRDAYFGLRHFDAQWYRNLGFVKNKV